MATDTKTTQRSVHIDDDVWREARLLALKTGISASELTTIALKREIERRKSEEKPA